MECFRKDPRFSTVQIICDKLMQSGYQALLAGGCVRDGILDILPNDYDVATNAVPDQVEAIFAGFAKTVAVGKSFGVIVVVLNDLEIEIATFRKDGGYQDGRRPDSVEFSSAAEDAKRRDFTINALFYDLKKNEVVDYVNGVYDIGQKKISAVGDPAKRFSEDHLRILRAVRFVSQLGFSLDANTKAAIEQMSSLVSTVSGERVHQELIKLLAGKDVFKALSLLYDSGILKTILGAAAISWKDPKKYFSMQEQEADKLWSLWWLWVQDLQGKLLSREEMDQYFSQFRLSRQQMSFAKKVLDISADKEALKKLSLGSVLVQMQDSAMAFGLEFFQKHENIFVSAFWQQIEEKRKDLIVTYPANYLQAADLPAEIKGPQIGEALKKAYEAQLEGLVTDKKTALEWILKKK